MGRAERLGTLRGLGPRERVLGSRQGPVPPWPPFWGRPFGARATREDGAGNPAGPALAGPGPLPAGWVGHWPGLGRRLARGQPAGAGRAAGAPWPPVPGPSLPPSLCRRGVCCTSSASGPGSPAACRTCASCAAAACGTAGTCPPSSAQATTRARRAAPTGARTSQPPSPTPPRRKQEGAREGSGFRR